MSLEKLKDKNFQEKIINNSYVTINDNTFYFDDIVKLNLNEINGFINDGYNNLKSLKQDCYQNLTGGTWLCVGNYEQLKFIFENYNQIENIYIYFNQNEKKIIINGIEQLANTLFKQINTLCLDFIFNQLETI